MGSQDLLLGLLMRPFSFCLHAILFCYYQILYCIIGRRGRFTNLSTPFFHVYLSGTYPRCVRQLVEHRGHRPRTLPLPLRLLGGVPRILQLPCLVDRTARPVSRLVDVPRRARRSRTAQPRTRAPLRRSGRKMLRPRWRRSWPAMPTTVRRRSPSPKDSFVFNSRFLASAIRTSSIALGLSKTFK